jgi:hypothetical protein
MPKYHIDTIPIWDAFREGCECPFCALARNCESDFLDIALGGALMEPDVRIATNESGFCASHLQKLLSRENKLGFALMLDTHLRSVLSSFEPAQAEVLRRAAEEKAKNPLARAASSVAKKSPFYASFERAAAQIEARTQSCFICKRVEHTMARYLETTLQLFLADSAFRELFSASKGFCLPHFAALLRAAARLGEDDAISIAETLLRLQDEQLRRVESDLEWFTLKFDYRNREKPWGDSKDAIERSLLKLRGQP